MSPAQHILEWCENSAEHHARLVGLSKYPRHGNFTTAASRMAFTLASDVYRAMRPDREEYSASDIIRAALIMVEWQEAV